MPLAGGAAEKFGNRYEGRWTVACMLDVMDEKADSIRLEPPGSEGQGVEFWIAKQGIREYHQVKRQRSVGNWTVNALKREGVLTNFAAKLHEDPTVRCVFVSAISAGQLAELSDRARRSANWEEFNEEFINTNQMRTDFDLVRRSHPGLPEQETYEQLKRVHIRTLDESSLRTMIESRASTLVDGDAATVVDVLAELASDRIHHILTALDIWNHLESRGFKRRHWDNDPPRPQGYRGGQQALPQPPARSSHQPDYPPTPRGSDSSRPAGKVQRESWRSYNRRGRHRQEWSNASGS